MAGLTFDNFARLFLKKQVVSLLAFKKFSVKLLFYRTGIISRKMKERNRLNFAGNIKHIYISPGYEQPSSSTKKSTKKGTA
jgi:hypothetical protein